MQFSQADLLEYAPIRKEHMATRAAYRWVSFCAAAIESQRQHRRQSDPDRAWADRKPSLPMPAHWATAPRGLDRNEQALNTAIPGDLRDTTTPAAMTSDLNALIQGTALSDDSRAALADMLNRCQTAAARIPAGLPTGWTSSNKTNSGDHGTTNDVAVVESPPDRAADLRRDLLYGLDGGR